MDARAHRLPTTVRPLRYDVHLDARLHRDTFHGRLALALETLEPRRTLELHARGLTLTDARLVRGARAWSATVTLDAARETATFALSLIHI